MKTEYRVLTLWEPWASLVVHGQKLIETRPRPTKWISDEKTRRVYLIHAARKWDMNLAETCFKLHFYEALTDIGKFQSRNDPRFYFGHIIGSVEVKECLRIKGNIFGENGAMVEYNEESGFVVRDPEWSFGDYNEGRYAWILQNQRVLNKPIPYKGGQGYYQKFKGDINQLIFEK